MVHLVCVKVGVLKYNEKRTERGGILKKYLTMCGNHFILIFFLHFFFFSHSTRVILNYENITKIPHVCLRNTQPHTRTIINNISFINIFNPIRTSYVLTFIHHLSIPSTIAFIIVIISSTFSSLFSSCWTAIIFLCSWLLCSLPIWAQCCTT